VSIVLYTNSSRPTAAATHARFASSCTASSSLELMQCLIGAVICTSATRHCPAEGNTASPSHHKHDSRSYLVFARSRNTDTAMTAPRGPTWKGEKCTSVHAWESAPLPRHAPSLDSGKQAVRITLVRKRAPRKGAQEERYVCKWYKTSGVMQTGIGGSKYIYREWSILSSVRHPNIVAYKDFSYDPNGAGLAKLYLEYCPRGDLSQHLKKGSRDDRLNYREGLQVLEQLTQAILYIHHGISRNGDSTALAVPVPGSSQPRGEDDPTKWVTILHRDIKPGNGKAHTHTHTHTHTHAYSVGDD
jgi:hypothetical protein